MSKNGQRKFINHLLLQSVDMTTHNTRPIIRLPNQLLLQPKFINNLLNMFKQTIGSSIRADISESNKPFADFSVDNVA